MGHIQSKRRPWLGECEYYHCGSSPSWGSAGGLGSSWWGSISLKQFGEDSRWWYKDGHRFYYAGLEDSPPSWKISPDVYEPTNPYMICLRVLIGLFALGFIFCILAFKIGKKQAESLHQTNAYDRRAEVEEHLLTTTNN